MENTINKILYDIVMAVPKAERIGNKKTREEEKTKDRKLGEYLQLTDTASYTVREYINHIDIKA